MNSGACTSVRSCTSTDLFANQPTINGGSGSLRGRHSGKRAARLPLIGARRLLRIYKYIYTLARRARHCLVEVDVVSVNPKSVMAGEEEFRGDGTGRVCRVVDSIAMSHECCRPLPA